MKSIIFLLLLINSPLLHAQNKAVKYVKYTYLNTIDSTTYSTLILTENESPYFYKHTIYDGHSGEPSSIEIIANDYIDSTYFGLYLSYSSSEWGELGVSHKVTEYNGEQQIQEEISLLIQNDSTIICSQIEVASDDKIGTDIYQLPAEAIEHYKRLANHLLYNSDSFDFKEKIRPFDQYGPFIGKQYFKTHETEDSTFTYQMTERYSNNIPTIDSVLISKAACPLIKNYTLNYQEMSVNKDKTYRRIKAKTPSYLNPKTTKLVAKGYKYEKRLLKRDSPSYVEIFYE